MNTPVKKHTHNGHPILVKWDDTHTFAGVHGGKVRACQRLAEGAGGLITASSRHSPQAQIVSRIAHAMGIPARLHMPKGKVTAEMEDVLAHGGEIIQHRAGYNNVIICRAREDHHARTRGLFTDGVNWHLIPFGMECREAMACTTEQVATLEPYLDKIKRIVIPIGSGMSACGLLWGLEELGCDWEIPVVGVQVGADPTKRINKYAPTGWRSMLEIIKSPLDYAEHAEGSIDGKTLDPVYEAKCLPFLQPGDLFWVVGIRTLENLSK